MRAASVPGRHGIHHVAACLTVAVRRGSMAMIGTPRRFASSRRRGISEPSRVSSTFAPHRMTMAEDFMVAASAPDSVQREPRRYGRTAWAAPLL